MFKTTWLLKRKKECVLTHPNDASETLYVWINWSKGKYYFLVWTTRRRNKAISSLISRYVRKTRASLLYKVFFTPLILLIHTSWKGQPTQSYVVLLYFLAPLCWTFVCSTNKLLKAVAWEWRELGFPGVVCGALYLLTFCTCVFFLYRYLTLGIWSLITRCAKEKNESFYYFLTTTSTIFIIYIYNYKTLFFNAAELLI